MNRSKLYLILALALFAAGCTMLGASVETLQRTDVKYSETFDKDIAQCYKTAKAALGNWKVTVSEEKEGRYLVATNCDKIFPNCINTTQVGIFFDEGAPGATKISVASLNSNLSKFTADKLFKYIKEGPEKKAPITPQKANWLHKRKKRAIPQ